MSYCGEYIFSILITRCILLNSVPQGSMVTQDHRRDRVRIYVDKKSNTVVRIPRMG
jgi:hypothetical protein